MAGDSRQCAVINPRGIDFAIFNHKQISVAGTAHEALGDKQYGIIKSLLLSFLERENLLQIIQAFKSR